jgi:hypothetical protein
VQELQVTQVHAPAQGHRAEPGLGREEVRGAGLDPSQTHVHPNFLQLARDGVGAEGGHGDAPPTRERPDPAARALTHALRGGSTPDPSTGRVATPRADQW